MDNGTAKLLERRQRQNSSRRLLVGAERAGSTGGLQEAPAIGRFVESLPRSLGMVWRIQGRCWSRFLEIQWWIVATSCGKPKSPEIRKNLGRREWKPTLRKPHCFSAKYPHTHTHTHTHTFLSVVFAVGDVEMLRKREREREREREKERERERERKNDTE